MAALARDKKFSEGGIRFVLLRKLGEAFVSDEVTREDLLEAIEHIRTVLALGQVHNFLDQFVQLLQKQPHSTLAGISSPSTCTPTAASG